MTLTLKELKPKREKTAMATRATRLSLRATKRKDSAQRRNLPCHPRRPKSKDLTSLKRKDLLLIMAQRTATKPRMSPRKRRDLRLNALILMRRRIRHRNSRMVSAMAMKQSARGDSSNFQSLLLVISIQPLLVFFKLKTQKST
jgi:hypothetical protein